MEDEEGMLHAGLGWAKWPQDGRMVCKVSEDMAEKRNLGLAVPRKYRLPPPEVLSNNSSNARLPQANRVNTKVTLLGY